MLPHSLQDHTTPSRHSMNKANCSGGVLLGNYCLEEQILVYRVHVLLTLGKDEHRRRGLLQTVCTIGRLLELA